MISFHDVNKKYLDHSFEDFKKIKVSDKLDFFERNDRIYDVLFSQQFKRDFLDTLFVLGNKIRLISKTKEGADWLRTLLSNKRGMLYFVQPSTRTFLSFCTACQILGMKTAEVRSMETSSEIKGESFDDTIRTFSSYFDMIIMRHPQAGSAEQASFALNKTKRPVPVISAGSGKDQHPTQALLDIFTLMKSFQRVGGLKNKTIMMVGDLKRGRTVRSLSYLLKNFNNVKIIYSSPKEFKMENDIKEFLKESNIPYSETTKFEEMIPEADAIYMTRIQDEHDKKRGDSKKVSISKFTFKEDHLKILKPNAIIMHPLPRRSEIELSVDEDPRAMYWRQERNGMWIRAALIAYIFRLENKILER
ncbi:aspartate carbamoyltransferase [Spirochaetota bacterium]